MIRLSFQASQFHSQLRTNCGRTNEGEVEEEMTDAEIKNNA